MNVSALFAQYFRELADAAQRGDAREESFYPALANMLKSVADATGRTHIHVTTLPKPTDAGNPDFRLWNGTDRIVGYVEAKHPSQERLDALEETTYYTGRSRGFHCMPRPEVMRHMLAGENVALSFTRQVKSSHSWQHCLVSNLIVESYLVSNHTSEIAYDTPLYLYTEEERRDEKRSGRKRWMTLMLFEPAAAYVTRKPNLSSALVAALVTTYGKAPSPEDIFHYVYAILYAPAYRAKYAQFLRMDFPRIPFTADAKLFTKLAGLGAKLVGLHLLKSPDLDPPACRFEGQGDRRVVKNGRSGLRYDAAYRRVYINATQYFARVPQAVWTYQIGGYQVCDKWLKDRRDRELGLEDIRTYCRIVTALARTIKLQHQLDALYSTIERAPLHREP